MYICNVIINQQKIHHIMLAISQQDLQHVFNINGLDSYDASDALRLNQSPNGDVLVDSKLYSYLTPWNCIIDTITEKSHTVK